MLALRGGSRVRERPFPSWPIWGEEERRLLLEVLGSGKWGIGGGFVERFAVSFANYQGCSYGVSCANGTVALKLALRAIGVKRGSEVITTPYTFIATASVIIELDAIPLFADIESNSLNINPEVIEEIASERTVAVVPVHIGGCPADMDKLTEVARNMGLSVIEDAAQAHGSEWKGKRVGSLGDAGCFSFQSSKIMTSGEGGIITTNNKEIAELSWSLSNCGRSRVGDWYQHELLGYNYRMTEFQAAVLLAQLSRLDAQIDIRRKNYERLSELVRELEGFELIEPPKEVTRHNHYLVPIRIDREFFGQIDKVRVVEALRAEGIPCSPGYTVPLYRYKPVREYLEASGYAMRAEDFPNAEGACRDVFWFPHRVLLGGYDDLLDIYEALRKLERHRGDL